MKSFNSKVTTKGQVVIPKRFRDKYGIHPTSDVVFEEREDGVLIKRALTFEEAKGFVKPHKVLTRKEMKRIINDAIIMKHKGKDADI